MRVSQIEIPSGEDTIGYIGCQPLFARDLTVFGYEILYRDSEENRTVTDDLDHATSSVLLRTLVDLEVDRMVGDKQISLNLTREFLLQARDLIFQGTKTILEIPVDLVIDDEARSALDELAADGYTIATDHVGPDFDNEPLISRSNIVKVDLKAHESADELAATVERLRRYDVRLLAAKVETNTDYALCRKLGFDCFQGFFFAEPTVIANQRVAENKAIVLRLLHALYKPDTSPQEIESIIRTDVTLSYKLLRCVNSAFFGLNTQIKSVSHAIIYLGLPTIRNWVNLLVLSSLDDKPDELFRLALQRARMCELMSGQLAPELRESAFTMGLFSLLPTLMDMSIAEITERLPLAEELQAALVSHSGQLGLLLERVIEYERGNLTKLLKAGAGVARMTRAYLNATKWAQEVSAGALAQGAG